MENIHKPKTMKDLGKKVEELKGRGYIPLMPGASKPHVSAGGGAVASNIFDASSGAIGGARGRRGGVFFNSKQSEPKSTSKGVGTEGLGYIPWGPADNLPNQIYESYRSLTFTASACEYLDNLTVGLGPQLMFRYSTVVNGAVVTKHIPYEDAGLLLQHRINELTAQGGGVGSEELSSLKSLYKKWKKANEEQKTFAENNNVENHYQRCVQDVTRMGIAFPTYGMERGRKGKWQPKIVEIDVLPAICTRFEQMDKDWRINHVYFSEKWRQDATKELSEKKEVAFPVLDAAHPLRDLRNLVSANSGKSPAARPTWVCSPTYTPSGDKPYYPIPSHWSIFPSDAYSYAASLLQDKAAARNNSTRFGWMIFLNLEYLKEVYAQQGVTEPDEQERIKNEIIDSVDNFLKDRKNNGKAVFLDSFLSNDQKTLWKSIEIVEVPQSDSDKFDENDIETLANIIFLAFGVNPNLIGVNMSKSSNGGTFQRELHLLKMQQISSHQRNYLTFLNNVCRFNDWPNAEWVIRQQVLTTLDRNANGLEATTSEQ